jgi:hypothetical protein
VRGYIQILHVLFSLNIKNTNMANRTATASGSNLSKNVYQTRRQNADDLVRLKESGEKLPNYTLLEYKNHRIHSAVRVTPPIHFQGGAEIRKSYLFTLTVPPKEIVNWRIYKPPGDPYAPLAEVVARGDTLVFSFTPQEEGFYLLLADLRLPSDAPEKLKTFSDQINLKFYATMAGSNNPAINGVLGTDSRDTTKVISTNPNTRIAEHKTSKGVPVGLFVGIILGVVVFILISVSLIAFKYTRGRTWTPRKAAIADFYASRGIAPIF